jgi:hypothetical protein
LLPSRRFLATSSENERVAAFKPYDSFPLLSFMDNPLVDLALLEETATRSRRSVRPLALRFRVDHILSDISD